VVCGLGYAATRRKIMRTGSGAYHNNMATHAYTAGAGRFEEPLTTHCCEGKPIKSPFGKIVNQLPKISGRVVVGLKSHPEIAKEALHFCAMEELRPSNSKSNSVPKPW
jgi:hypothetical protein